MNFVSSHFHNNKIIKKLSPFAPINHAQAELWPHDFCRMGKNGVEPPPFPFIFDKHSERILLLLALLRPSANTHSKLVVVSTVDTTSYTALSETVEHVLHSLGILC